MLDLISKIAVMISACIAFLALCVGVVHYTNKFIKWCRTRREKRLLTKDEKKRIEKEKEIAYKLYLEAKSKEIK